MKQAVTIGVVCLARKTFDFNAAQEIYARIQADLAGIENATFKCIPALVIEVPDAHRAGHELVSVGVDALVVISGTFALGHLVLELAKAVRRPVLLWGLNELPYDGGKIRLNSVCGVNLNASNLYKAGLRDYHVVVGDQIDEDWVDAIRALVALRDAHVGILGYHAHGFFNLDSDELTAYQELGCLVDHFELRALFDIEVEPAVVAAQRERVEALFDLSEMSPEQVEKVSALAAKFEQFMEGHGLTVLAVRCWPEFAAEYGISPCAAMSLLQADGRIIACEGDVEAALSMLAHVAVGGETPFLADLSQVNLEENFALLWHCGVAPCNLWDGICTRSLDTYFAGGKGVTAGFVMKPGRVSLLRIDSAGSEYRIFLQPATGVPMTKDLKGTYLKVHFDAPVREVLDTVVYNGIAHHLSMVYGEYLRPFEILAKLNGWRVIR